MPSPDRQAFRIRTRRLFSSNVLKRARIPRRYEHCTFENVTEPDVVENVEGLKFDGVTMNGKARR